MNAFPLVSVSSSWRQRRRVLSVRSRYPQTHPGWTVACRTGCGRGRAGRFAASCHQPGCRSSQPSRALPGCLAANGACRYGSRRADCRPRKEHPNRNFTDGGLLPEDDPIFSGSWIIHSRQDSPRLTRDMRSRHGARVYGGPNQDLERPPDEEE